MAASTAEIQILKQNENIVSFKVVGTGEETAATLIDASTLTGATGISNLLSITKLDWSINADQSVTLLWEGGSTNVNIMKMSRSGKLYLDRELNSKLSNNASAPTGDILVSSTSGVYTLFFEAEKTGSGWTKLGQYN